MDNEQQTKLLMIILKAFGIQSMVTGYKESRRVYSIEPHCFHFFLRDGFKENVRKILVARKLKRYITSTSRNIRCVYFYDQKTYKFVDEFTMQERKVDLDFVDYILTDSYEPEDLKEKIKQAYGIQ